MAVSANTLFHFTKLESLKGILKSRSLWPQYSKEHLFRVFPKESAYRISHVPMISFCDLRLTQLSNSQTSIHTTDFGKYGIGFYKKWGFKNGISPVSYVHDKSKASNVIYELSLQLRGRRYAKLKQVVPELIQFVKPYQSFYQKGKKVSLPRRHYDEREWRFVPNDKKFRVFPNDASYNSEIEQLNKQLKNSYALSYDPDDIKFIVVHEDKDKNEVTDTIKAVIFRQDSKGNEQAQTELITKIISLEELNEDY